MWKPLLVFTCAAAVPGYEAVVRWPEKNAGLWPCSIFNETRGRIRWMLRINPTPKTPDGEVVNLQGIFDGIDTSSAVDYQLQP